MTGITLLALVACGGDSSTSVDESDGSTGPVTRQVQPGGGSLTVRTANGTSLRLDFPPGAVRIPTSVTVRPLSPSGSSFFRVALEPARLVFFEPVAVIVTVPDGVSLTDQWFAFRPDEPIYIDTTTDRTARTMTTSLRFFGFSDDGTWSVPMAPPIHGVQAPGGNQLTNVTATCAQIAASARLAFDSFQQGHLHEDALSVALVAGTTLELLNCPEIDEFKMMAETAACDGLKQAIDQAASTTTSNLTEFYNTVKEIIDWVGIAQEYAENCPENDTFITQIDNESTEWVLFYEGRLGTITGNDFATFQDLKDEAESAFELEGAAAEMGLVSAREKIDNLAFQPAVNKLRNLAYQLCRNDHWHYPLSRVTSTGFFAARDIIGQPSPRAGVISPAPSRYADSFSDDDIYDDLQYCATCLQLEALAVSGGSLAAQSAGGQGLPGQRVNTITLQAPTRGTLKLDCDVWGFTCFDGTHADDELVLSLEGTDVLTLRRPVGGDNYLASGAEAIDVEAMAQAAHITPKEGDTSDLKIRRRRPNCDYRLWGDAEFTLLTATLEWKNPTLTASIDYPDQVFAGDANPATVTIDVVDQLGQAARFAGIDVTLTVTGGHAGQVHGVTDSNGQFQTTVTADAPAVASKNMQHAGGFVTINAGALSSEGATTQASKIASIIGPHAEISAAQNHLAYAEAGVINTTENCSDGQTDSQNGGGGSFSGNASANASCPMATASASASVQATAQMAGAAIVSLTFSGSGSNNSLATAASGGSTAAPTATQADGFNASSADWFFEVVTGPVGYDFTATISGNNVQPSSVSVQLRHVGDPPQNQGGTVIEEMRGPGTITKSGILQPGRYEFFVRAASQVSNGSGSAQGSATLTFDNNP